MVVISEGEVVDGGATAKVDLDADQVFLDQISK